MEEGIENASQGGGGGTEPLIVDAVRTTVDCDEQGQVRDRWEYSHSWTEIYNALLSGTPTFVKLRRNDGGNEAVLEIALTASFDGEYIVLMAQDSLTFADATSLVYLGECSR